MNERYHFDDITASMEEMIRYPIYYRRHGVRLPMQLVMPTLGTTSDLVLPQMSVLHYLPEDETMYGIPQDDPILNGIERLIMVETITALGDTKGNPIPIRIPPGPLMRAYHRKYRRTRPLLNFSAAAGNPRTLIVENYALLPHLNRYLNNFFRPFNKWWNIQATIWKRMDQIADISDRQQFIQYKLPKILPTLAQLRKAEKAQTRQTLSPFKTPESLMVLELWKWLGNFQDTSLMAFCKPTSMEKVNLILEHGDQWLLLNMGKLVQWRKTTEHPEGVISPENLQRRFLRMLMILLDVQTTGVADIDADEEITPPNTADGLTDLSKPQGSPSKITLPVNTAPDEFKTVPPTETTAMKAIVAKVGTEEGTTKRIKVLRAVNKDVLPDNVVTVDIDEAALDQQIDKDLAALDTMYELFEKAVDEGRIADTSSERIVTTHGTGPIEFTDIHRSLTSGVMDRVNELADNGFMSAAEYRRFSALADGFKKLPDPYGSDQTLDDVSKVDEKMLVVKTEHHDNRPKITDIKTVLDKSMLFDPLKMFTEQYVQEVLPKDVLSAVLSIQHAGIAVSNYEIEKRQDALNEYENHSVQLTPVQGAQSTIKFRIPKINPDGTFTVAGSKNRLRNQRRDIPIRKIAFNKVALTSYYAKVFVGRSEKQVNNYQDWLTNKLAALVMSGSNDIQNVLFANVFDNLAHTPSVYSAISRRFRSFQIGEYRFFFDYKSRKSEFGESIVNEAEHDGFIVVGQSPKAFLLMDANGFIYEDNNKELKEIGTFETLLNFTGNPPLEIVEIKVFSKLIPLGIVLAYKLGFQALLKTIKASYRIVPVGERTRVQPNEFQIRFENESYVFARDNRVVTLLLAGFTAYDGFTRNYSSHMFDRPEVYLPLLESTSIGIRYLREIDLMTDMFVDPITRSILEEMNEPTSFMGLLLRSTELLTSDYSPAETDMESMRIVGYERIPGVIYGELVKSVRMMRSRGGSSKAKIELHPSAVWMAITQDASVKIAEDSNPVNNVKEKSEVTYVGAGGRSSRSMVGRTRLFQQSDLGVISEASKDSDQVAVTTYFTAAPNIRSLRGITNRYDPDKDGPAVVNSTTALLSPASDRDSTIRTVFADIQHSSSTFAVGYRSMPTRTGYEQVIASRTDDLFATVAKTTGKVTALSKKAITVTYDDGTSQTVELGRRYGKVAALTFPHEVITGLSDGDTVEAGQIVAYNSHYFEPDPLTGGKTAVWKAGCLATVALMESSDTLEDSCAISEHLAGQLETRTVEVRSIIVDFKDTIHGLVEPGRHVEVEDILCTIEDPVTAQGHLFDERSLDTLRLISSNNPRAKVTGDVEKIEVFYHGDIDDLSPSLLELAQESDRQRKRLSRDLKTVYTSGYISDTLSIDGKRLAPNQAVIRVYINVKRIMQTGDKGVFGNQLKSVVGRVMHGVNQTEYGENIDAIFGYLSVNNRIVRSPEVIGTTNKLSQLITQHAIAAYRKGK